MKNILECKVMLEILETKIWNNTVEEWIISIIAFFLIYCFLYLFKILILNRLEKLCEKTKNQFDNILISTVNSIPIPFYFFISVWGTSQLLTLPDLVVKIINWFTLVLVIYYLTIAVQRLVEHLLSNYLFKKNDDIGSTLIVKKFINQITKILIWTIALLLILQNLGFEISVLLGGVGIAGLAIGFAIQNILEDIFSFFSIYFDKPFEIGDLIIIDEQIGTVEAIGIKSTRIRSLQGQELVISNKELISKQIHNFRKMLERRIIFKFGITYETSYDKLKKVNDIIKGIFDNIDNARIDRVHFYEYGDFSLNYEVVYYVTTQDYYTYMDTQEFINLEMFKKFEKEGISFAYPTKRVLLEKK